MTHRGRTIPHSGRRAAAIVAALVCTLVGRAASAEETRGPSLAELAAKDPPWTVGIVAERGLHAIIDKALVDDQLFGLGVTRYVARRYGIHARALVSPNYNDIVNTRGFFGAGLRLRTDVFGVTTFLGAGAHVEARLRNHYWLTYVTPFEVGVTLWTHGSFRVELYAGARAVIAGDLVNHFLLDPNGVNNVLANEALDAEKRRPWEGYLSLVVGRAL